MDCFFGTCQSIASSYNPDKSIKIDISNKPSEGDVKLDILYSTALKHIAAQNTGSGFVDDCSKVLGAIVTLRDPLPAVAIAKLIGEDLDMIQGIIQRLDCLVTQTSSAAFVRVIHASLARWLTSSSNKTPWAISAIPMHRCLTARSLSLMNHSLHINMLDLSDGDISALHYPQWTSITNQEELVNSHIPLELQYACQFWASHLLELEPEQEWQNEEIMGSLSAVLTIKPVEWVEVLAYLKKLTWAVDMLERVYKWVQALPQCESVISNCIYDVKQFIQSSAAGILESPLQIYMSGVLFIPQQTTLYKCYEKHVHQLPIKLLQGVELIWGRALNIAAGHEDVVTSVTFSSDETLIASGSRDTTVWIWDANTGAAVCQPLQGHSHWVTSVAFSPDGTFIVSGSNDKTLCIWDAKTGTAVGQPLQGHSDWVRSVALSPDGTLIASGSDDKTVYILDATTGVAVGQPFHGHSNLVTSVVFSPDSTLIASGSYDNTVCIWDAETGAAVGQPLWGHSLCITSVAFSPDGTLIASGSGDKTLCIWDAKNGAAVGQPLQGHSCWVRSVAFSPDGTLIASGSEDKTVHIWDAKTGAAVGQPLHGHSHGICIAAGSYDDTVHIWDARTGAAVGQSIANQSTITSAAMLINTDHDSCGLSIARHPSGNIWLCKYSQSAGEIPVMWIPSSFGGTPYIQTKMHEHSLCCVFAHPGGKLTIIQANF